jgi:dTDP-4-dehydrorhamnose reductase
MRVLVIGGSGFIGSHVLEYLSAEHTPLGTFYENPDVHVEKCGHQRLDVTDRTAVHGMVSDFRPDIVFLVCGSQNIELCSGLNGRMNEAERAWTVHVDGTRNTVEACQSHGRRLAYVSTDCVVDGSKPVFSEADACNPFNAYGRMKRRAEKIIEVSSLNHLIIRVSLTFGWRRHPKQFNNYALRVLDQLSEKNGVVVAAENLFNTPIEVTAAADAISNIALRADKGVFHVASQDRISRYDFARAVAATFGYAPTRVVPSEDTGGLRQRNSCLSVDLAESVLGKQLESFADGLRCMHDEQGAR